MSLNHHKLFEIWIEIIEPGEFLWEKINKKLNYEIINNVEIEKISDDEFMLNVDYKDKEWITKFWTAFFSKNELDLSELQDEVFVK